MKVDSEVLVMAAEDKNQNKLKYVTASAKTWGTYRSDFFTGPASTDFNKIQDLKEAINPPSDNAVIDELIKSQHEYIAKFIKKRNK